MFGPWIEAWEWLRGRRPNSLLKRPHLNFITIHYIYITTLILVGSILIYPAGGLSYIDALFFASGSATQSGLTTVDVNNINTFQQIVLYLLPMIATPIFIHSSVVFIRLSWFEKRFQHVVKESRLQRRSRSRIKTETKDERDVGREENGVNGRNIVVLHRDREDQARNQRMPRLDEEKSLSDKGVKVLVPFDHDGTREETIGATRDPDATSASSGDAHPILHREISFADQRTPGHKPEISPRNPDPRNAEHHIAFLENQRNPKDKGTLRIPGPRDYDRGVVPQTLEEDVEGNGLTRRVTSATEPNTSALPLDGGWEEHKQPTDFTAGDHAVRRAITIDEPDPPRIQARSSTLKFRKPISLPRTASIGATLDRVRTRAGTFSSFLTSHSNHEPTPYLSWTPTVGRNSAFVDLTEEQREELGGIEYRALKTLAIILVSYYVFFHLFGVVCMAPWIVRSGTYGSVADKFAQSRAWWGIFTPASMFNDLGFTLTPDSMISFQRAVFPLLLGSFLIVIGNTGFPCMLRLVIWLTSHFAPRDSGLWEELKFLLDHPRRCFTLLFPSKATWWLFWILVIFNVLDLIFFVTLDLNDPTVTSLPPGIRVLDGWFQATSTRTAGFSVVNLAELHAAIQVSYLIMMYVSVLPIAISVRRTNVYEEKSLGIYGSKDEQVEDEQDASYVGAHLRKQLSFDLWYVFLGLFVICIAEGKRIENTNEYAFTIFSVLFEIISAYGTVGLSLGYPSITASFSSQFSTVSKLVIIAMQLRGRHRGLPYELDRAILLPSETLHKQEDQDARERKRRRNSVLSTVESTGRSVTSARAATFPMNSSSNGPAAAKTTPVRTPSKEGWQD